ncbi:hypothetical protein BIW11_11745 [Tropilaelaps mercedesae]|uniref:Uncharacterized protein n=1 Tax=Tropilaelaps mercedesae TaxID=418985 RepID=A0A1V9X9M5_9ACAR|nr:hypothetical protein BIW11_11745 [Tropilaelaps mercedesae]
MSKSAGGGRHGGGGGGHGGGWSGGGGGGEEKSYLVKELSGGHEGGGGGGGHGKKGKTYIIKKPKDMQRLHWAPGQVRTKCESSNARIRLQSPKHAMRKHDVCSTKRFRCYSAIPIDPMEEHMKAQFTCFLFVVAEKIALAPAAAEPPGNVFRQAGGGLLNPVYPPWRYGVAPPMYGYSMEAANGIWPYPPPTAFSSPSYWLPPVAFDQPREYHALPPPNVAEGLLTPPATDPHLTVTSFYEPTTTSESVSNTVPSAEPATSAESPKPATQEPVPSESRQIPAIADNGTTVTEKTVHHLIDELKGTKAESNSLAQIAPMEPSTGYVTSDSSNIATAEVTDISLVSFSLGQMPVTSSVVIDSTEISIGGQTSTVSERVELTNALSDEGQTVIVGRYPGRGSTTINPIESTISSTESAAGHDAEADNATITTEFSVMVKKASESGQIN